MREIKGFHVNENGNTVITVNGKDYKGEWVYGSLLDLVTGIYILPIDTSYNEIDVDLGQKITINAMWEDNDFFEVLPETVSQYTGRNDKSDNKIYENCIVDICYNDKHFATATVKYINNQFVLDVPGYVLSQSVWEDENYSFEIIGSIFDNPEQLESEATK